MKNLQGKEINRGDQVIAKIGTGNYYAGQVYELYERNVADPTKPGKTMTTQRVRISGYNVNLEPGALVNAGDAFEALASTITPPAS